MISVIFVYKPKLFANKSKAKKTLLDKKERLFECDAIKDVHLKSYTDQWCPLKKLFASA